MTRDKESERVFVIGLDGATPDLIVKWVRQGKLPTFAKLIENGVSGTLRSTIPPLTCPAWLSFATGKNPAKLGVFDFFDRKPHTYEIRYAANFQSVRSRFLWDILGERGRKVGIFNVPTTFPPRRVNGFIVSGWPIPQGAVFTYPRDLQEKLDVYAGKTSWGERTIAMATWRWFSGEDEFLKGLDKSTEWEVKATRYLVNSCDWDVFVTVFSGLDPVQHFFWKHMDSEHPLHNPEMARRYGDEILRWYQKIDEILKELIDSVGDARIIIMSDHGCGAFHNLFNLNDWLRLKGFLRINESRHSPTNWMLKLLPRREKIFDLLTQAAHMLGVLKIYYFVTNRSSLLRALTKNARNLVGLTFFTSPSLEDIDVEWSNTRAYSYGAGEAGRIYINLKGREPRGIVEPGKEYEELRDHLIKELRNLVDPKTGKGVDIDVFKKEEIYRGEYVDQAPDIVFFINKGRTRMDWNFGHDNFFTSDLSFKRDNAGHKMNGILFMKGPGIAKGKTIDQAEIIDLAPTILYLMGCPVSSDMDGKVLVDALDPSYLKSNPIRYAKMAKRDGNWIDGAIDMRVSVRYGGPAPDSVRMYESGGRCARTSP